ncbi:MAG: phosphoribosylformylglycinamidine cyclo-ligase [Nannocystales bacterium]
MADTPKSLSYRDAGVDIDAGNEAVRRIRSLVASTRRPEQLDDIGGFAGMIGLPTGMKTPVLVSCADGVGTKLLVAIAAGVHDTVGIDLVAMNVNDLICTGARPLFLLDYIATGALQPGIVESIVAGIVDGCRQSGCALLGGETAELPGMYSEGHYDLAAFAVGVVDKDARLNPTNVQPGDVAIGVLSSGLHSNGYSLARRALLDPEFGGLNLGDTFPGTESSVADVLLTPTRVYVKAIAAALSVGGVSAAAHITGGGLLENPPRALPEGTTVEIDTSAIPPMPVFEAISAQGVTSTEMLRTFNSGIGMMLFTAPDAADTVISALEGAGESAVRMGRVVASEGDAGVRFV